MPLPTFSEARDEVMELFRVAWASSAAYTESGDPAAVAWPGVDTGAPAPKDQPSARLFVQHASSRQTTLGRTGERRFTRNALITVQVFAPTGPRKGLSDCEALSVIARDAFEGVGTASGIWFRNVRIVEVGPDAGLYQMNVRAEFQYDELK